MQGETAGRIAAECNLAEALGMHVDTVVGAYIDRIAVAAADTAVVAGIAVEERTLVVGWLVAANTVAAGYTVAD
jgi:hypothetical protein